MSHTPLPWSFDAQDTAILGPDSEYLFRSDGWAITPLDVDMEFIVKAVNCHQELVDALKASIANHCPNDAFFCGTCSPARKLLARVAEA